MKNLIEQLDCGFNKVTRITCEKIINKVTGKQLGLDTVALVFFIEKIDDENGAEYEVGFFDDETGVKVTPVFAETGLIFFKMEIMNGIMFSPETMMIFYQRTSGWPS